MSHFLNVDNILFTIFSYPMSCIEFFGTIFYLWSVWLISKRNILTWPIGIIGVLLYMILFYQIRLYSDSLEQVYYLVASVYGWYYWSGSSRDNYTITEVVYGSKRIIIACLVLTAVFSLLLGIIMVRIHEWLPLLFPEAASYPFIDAMTTVMSLVAMWLMARRHIESWFYWIFVDIFGIWLYFIKDVRFIAMLYVVLLILAVKGLINWQKLEVRAFTRLKHTTDIV
jgi:nicotinamide mononucleotide transporter